MSDAFIHHPSSGGLRVNGIVHEGNGYLPINVGDFVGIAPYSEVNENTRYNRVIDLGDTILCLHNDTNLLYASIYDYYMNRKSSVLIANDYANLSKGYSDTYIRKLNDDPNDRRYIVAWVTNIGNISARILKLNTSNTAMTIGTTTSNIAANLQVNDPGTNFSCIGCIAVNDNYIYICYTSTVESGSYSQINVSCLTFSDQIMTLISTDIMPHDTDIISTYYFINGIDLGNGCILGTGVSVNSKRNYVKLTISEENIIQKEKNTSSIMNIGIEDNYNNCIKILNTKWLNLDGCQYDITFSDIGFDIIFKSIGSGTFSFTLTSVFGKCKISDKSYYIHSHYGNGYDTIYRIYKITLDDNYNYESFELLHNMKSNDYYKYDSSLIYNTVFVNKGDNPRVVVFINNRSSYDTNLNDLTIVTSANMNKITNSIYGICTKKLGNSSYEYVVPYEQ